MTAESDVNLSEITNRCGRLRESSWRTAALIAMACGLTIWTRAWNFRDSFRVKKTNPIGRVFWLFPELNASAFARRLGIPQPLFAAYVNGTKKPSSARKKLIDEELRRIGRELLKTVA